MSRYLTRREAAEYLTNEGFPCATATLAKYAWRGEGPPFVRFGLRVLYSEDALITWAVSRSRLHRSTSDPGTPMGSPPGGAASPPTNQDRAWKIEK